jgi:GntR family transcriptional regulator
LKKVSKESPLPLYYQVKEILLEMIDNGELKPGQLIPPEREICDIQNVSRMTVNKAIMTLVNEGYLYREQGKGTFVSKPKENQQLQLKGFTQQMIEQGMKSSSLILSFEIKEATKKDIKILNLQDEHSTVFEIKRLRILNDEPFAIEVVWIPEKLCAGLTQEMLEGSSLYEIFEQKYNLTLKKAKQTVEPKMLNEYESKLLKQNPNSLALMFNRITYLENGIPIEYTKEIYRSDKYKYEIELT